MTEKGRPNGRNREPEEERGGHHLERKERNEALFGGKRKKKPPLIQSRKKERNAVGTEGSRLKSSILQRDKAIYTRSQKKEE